MKKGNWSQLLSLGVVGLTIACGIEGARIADSFIMEANAKTPVQKKRKIASENFELLANTSLESRDINAQENAEDGVGGSFDKALLYINDEFTGEDSAECGLSSIKLRSHYKDIVVKKLKIYFARGPRADHDAPEESQEIDFSQAPTDEFGQPTGGSVNGRHFRADQMSEEMDLQGYKRCVNKIGVIGFGVGNKFDGKTANLEIYGIRKPRRVIVIRPPVPTPAPPPPVIVVEPPRRRPVFVPPAKKWSWDEKENFTVEYNNKTRERTYRIGGDCNAEEISFRVLEGPILIKKVTGNYTWWDGSDPASGDLHLKKDKLYTKGETSGWMRLFDEPGMCLRSITVKADSHSKDGDTSIRFRLRRKVYERN